MYMIEVEIEGRASPIQKKEGGEEILMTPNAMLTTTTMHVCVPAVMSRCGLRAFGDGDGDFDLLDANLVHDAILGVDGGGDDAVVVAVVVGVGGRSGGRRGNRRGRRASRGSRRRDVVHGNASWALGVGRGVALRGDRGDRRHGRLGGGLAAAGARLERVGVFGAVLHGDVTAETVGGAGAVVVLERGGGVLDLAGALLGLGLEVAREDGAVFDAAGEVGARVDGGLEGIDVPTVDEVGVVSVSGGVTVGPNKLSCLALERIGVPDGFVEKGGQANWEALGTIAAVDQAGVGDMTLVVIGGNILSIPARSKHDLGADAIGAVVFHVLLGGQEVAVARTFRRLAVVHAVHSNGLLTKRQLCFIRVGPGRCRRVRHRARKVAKTRVAGEHLEALGESLDVVAQEKIVGKHTTDLGDNLRLAIFVRKVK